VIWTAVKVAAGVLGWIVLLTTGMLLAGALAVLLADWYRRIRYRRREQEAQAATQQARDIRLLKDLQAQTWTDDELAALRQERGDKKGRP
jgi:hypothetical protein